MTTTQKDRRASELITRCGLMQDIAIENYDLPMFFKYHAMALWLIEYRIRLTKEMFKLK